MFKKKRKKAPSPPVGEVDDNKMSKALGSRWSVQCRKRPWANEWALTEPLVGCMDRSWMPSAIRVLSSGVRVLSSHTRGGRRRATWAESHWHLGWRRMEKPCSICSWGNVPRKPLRLRKA